MADDTRDQIALIAEGLNLNDTRRMRCLYCHDNAHTFTVTRVDDGVVYSCYRDSCRLMHKSAGFLGSRGVYRGKAAAPKTLKKVFTGSVFALIDEDHYILEALYGFSADDIARARIKYCPERGRYVLPVLDPYGTQRGVVLRRVGGEDDGWPKAISYQDTVDSLLCSWYNSINEVRFQTIVLVEDIFSAMSVARAGAVGVALLGTHLTSEVMAEVAAQMPTQVIVALDRDATAQAIKHVRAHALTMPGIRYAVLDKDLKDLGSDDAIRTVLGL